MSICYTENMAKQKKKRNKAYSGSGAAMTRPSVTRISAINRSKSGQWWFEHKRIVRVVAIATLVILAIILIAVGLIGLLF